MSGAVTTHPDERVIAMYENNTCAHLARDALVAAGVPRGAIHVIERPESGWLAAFASLFTPTEDAASLNVTPDHAHAMVVLTPDQLLDRNRAMQVLTATTPLACEPRIVRARQPV